jgi:hypothetical protein
VLIKFDKDDIVASRQQLELLHKNGNLNIDIDQLDIFLDLLCSIVLSRSQIQYFLAPPDPFRIKENLLTTIQAFSTDDLKYLQIKFVENLKFEGTLFKSFQQGKRLQLKKKLIDLDNGITQISFDEAVSKSFQLDRRSDLKKRLIRLDKGNLEVAENKNTTDPLDLKNEDAENLVIKKGKVFSIKPFLVGLSIAASLLLIFFVWQPQHTSDGTLFSDYTVNLEPRTLTDLEKSDLIKESSGVRGEEELFNNFTFNETNKLLEAIKLVRNKQFAKAEEIFTSLRVQKEKNPGLTLYLSIAQLQTGKLQEGVKNLEYLSNLSGFSNIDDAKFHLAFAYIKYGDRNKARIFLKDLVISKSKFAAIAQETLKKIRWF